MLEAQVRALLGEGVAGIDLSKVQPFQGNTARKPVSFFCTTSFLNAGISLLLGRDFLTADPTWDAVYASLSSSAFPAVFAARQESDFLPGSGRADRFFADGGLFDNLPFFPAIEVMSAIQQSQGGHDARQIRTDVVARAQRPHLIVAAGLNARPRLEHKCSTLFQIKGRANSLSVESKTESFKRAAEKTVECLDQLSSAEYQARFNSLSPADLSFIKGSVSAKVVAISPTDAEHINPTFAFCRSTGLEKRRVQQSIADGCFQTLLEIQRNEDFAHVLKPEQTIALIAPPQDTARNNCTYFRKDQKPLICPFTRPSGAGTSPALTHSQQAEVAGVWKSCCTDAAHKLIQLSWPRQ